MLNKKLGCYISVISHKRSVNVPKVSGLIGNATWIVGAGEKQHYRDAGAEFVVEGGGLCESRNLALVEAENLSVPCVQISDDLRKLEIAEWNGDKETKKTSRPISFEGAVNLILERMAAEKLMLGGVAPTANLFYYNKPTASNLFVIGDFIVVRPCGLYFDEGLKLKEDYDYTLQHFDKYGGALRCNDILAHFLHRTNAGGAVASRTSELEQKSIAHLKAKWPDLIVDNPRRPDEILISRKNLKLHETRRGP